MTARKRRTTKRKPYLEKLSQIIRLIVLFALCAFIVYQLFKPEKKKDDSITPETDQEQVRVDEPEEGAEESIPQKIDISTLPKEEALDVVLQNVFDKFQIKQNWISRNQKILKIELPSQIPSLDIIYEIIQQIQEIGLKYTNSFEDLQKNRSTLAITSDDKTLLTIIIERNKSLTVEKANIAIVIDDFGYYDDEVTDQFLTMNYPLNLAILPGQRYTETISRKAKKNAKTIMLHLPMEPLNDEVEQTDFTIMTKMSNEEIAFRVNTALNLLLNAVAVNNHMGSKATADSRVMDVIFVELKQRDVMFIDSKTTNISVAPSIAKKYQLRFAQNDAFLEVDKNSSEDHIRNKLRAAANIARRHGQAVIIGHPYRKTMNVLKEELPKLEQQGFNIVPITQIKSRY